MSTTGWHHKFKGRTPLNISVLFVNWRCGLQSLVSWVLMNGTEWICWLNIVTLQNGWQAVLGWSVTWFIKNVVDRMTLCITTLSLSTLRTIWNSYQEIPFYNNLLQTKNLSWKCFFKKLGSSWFRQHRTPTKWNTKVLKMSSFAYLHICERFREFRNWNKN